MKREHQYGRQQMANAQEECVDNRLLHGVLVACKQREYIRHREEKQHADGNDGNPRPDRSRAQLSQKQQQISAKRCFRKQAEQPQRQRGAKLRPKCLPVAG
ncbi:hypothetical protein SDC9_202707 [bioreactor metagenome]|uniref:Uncharacterized protein n=1 Tax=bioreactor metagenome TaxID=1076179 RepID=A0A645IUD7_9ZZZZ